MMVMGSDGSPELRALAAQSELASTQKSPAVAFVFCIFLGVFGAHRFYLRRTVLRPMGRTKRHRTEPDCYWSGGGAVSEC
jgi:hypothetical protein